MCNQCESLCTNFQLILLINIRFSYRLLYFHHHRWCTSNVSADVLLSWFSDVSLSMPVFHVVTYMLHHLNENNYVQSKYMFFFTTVCSFSKLWCGCFFVCSLIYIADDDVYLVEFPGTFKELNNIYKIPRKAKPSQRLWSSKY